MRVSDEARVHQEDDMRHKDTETVGSIYLMKMRDVLSTDRRQDDMELFRDTARTRGRTGAVAAVATKDLISGPVDTCIRSAWCYIPHHYGFKQCEVTECKLDGSSEVTLTDKNSQRS